jgi:cation diffusion facilitator family transporter
VSALPPVKLDRLRNEREFQDARFAMRISLIVGLVMLAGKVTAYLLTHSAAIFSDAAESVVHVIAVAFAAFSLRLSAKPAAPQFLYGYERITFFSAGFEGAMIVVAAVAIVAAAIQKWIAGLTLENLSRGTFLVLVAGILNAGLGDYLLRVGVRTKSLILEADGKHVLTDSLTSFGVVAGLGLVFLTHWKLLDSWLRLSSLQTYSGRAGAWFGIQRLDCWITPIQTQAGKLGKS